MPPSSVGKSSPPLWRGGRHGAGPSGQASALAAPFGASDDRSPISPALGCASSPSPLAAELPLQIPVLLAEEDARPRRRRCARRHDGQAGAPGRRPPCGREDQRLRRRITVSGPIVPGEGLPEQPTATTCTWTVTMKDATADVPVSIADFHSVDHLGAVFLMGLVPGRASPAVRPPQGPDAHLQAPGLRVDRRRHDAVGARPPTRRRRLGLHRRERLTDHARTTDGSRVKAGREPTRTDR